MVDSGGYLAQVVIIAAGVVLGAAIGYWLGGWEGAIVGAIIGGLLGWALALSFAEALVGGTGAAGAAGAAAAPTMAQQVAEKVFMTGEWFIRGCAVVDKFGNVLGIITTSGGRQVIDFIDNSFMWL